MGSAGGCLSEERFWGRKAEDVGTGEPAFQATLLPIGLPGLLRAWSVTPSDREGRRSFSVPPGL